MTDDVADMLSGAPAGPGPTDGGDAKNDPVYQMLTGAPPDAPAPAGPAAPAQPGAPRAKARLPPPTPGAPPGGIVTAKEDLSPGAVLSGAWQNAGGSALNQITQTLKPLLDWQGDAQLAHTLFTDPGKVASAVGDVYGSRYDLAHPDREGGILQTFKHDPFAPLSDAAAVASLLTGGELLAPRLAGTAGDVAGIVGKVGRAGQYLDPAYGAAQAVGKPVAAMLRHPDFAAGVGRNIGRVGGAAAGLAIPVPGAHLVTGMVGEHVGGELGAGVGRIASKVAATPFAQGAMRTAEGLIPAGTVATGMAPMSPQEQAQTPYGQGQAAPPAPGGPAGGGGGGPQLDPRYADDPVYQMLMGGSPGPGPGSPGSAVGAGDPGNVADVIRQAEGGSRQPVGYTPGGGSSARGAYQMIDGTYAANLRKYHPNIAAGMSPDQIKSFRNTDQGWALNETMGRQMVGDEMAQLQSQGIAPTADNVGTLHMLGSTRLLHADPSTPIEQVTTAGQRNANAKIFRNIRTAGDYLAWMHQRNATAASQMRPAHAAGGQVIDMTEKLLQRAGQAQKAAQASTKPLLGLSDDTVAQALRVAQRGF